MADRWWLQWNGTPERWQPTNTQAARQRFYLPWLFFGVLATPLLMRATSGPVALAFLVVWGIAGIVILLRLR